MFSKFAVVAFVLPIFAQSAVAQTCTRSYTVQSGDYCDKISAANNVSTYQLVAANPGLFNADCSNLQPGSSVCLGYQGEDCTTTYTVQAQDTCDKITSAYGINSTTLNGNNPQINSGCTNIYVGEVLCVAGDIAAPPAGATSINTGIPASATAAASAVPTTVASSTVDSSSADSSSAASSSAAPSSVAAAPSATPTDDDDLPYCDEL